ncbi:hypothetical protein [Formivibrio citricus]|uniref:hypothetical protein n=1 Tax=Formivibrio citricus TaxID=83765 RepID=UPI000B81F637|nr:hypothetical protein [Formivibrio citricus]
MFELVTPAQAGVQWHEVASLLDTGLRRYDGKNSNFTWLDQYTFLWKRVKSAMIDRLLRGFHPLPHSSSITQCVTASRTMEPCQPAPCFFGSQNIANKFAGGGRGHR